MDAEQQQFLVSSFIYTAFKENEYKSGQLNFCL